jgi:lipid-binding SYLF domain-containing protein
MKKLLVCILLTTTSAVFDFAIADTKIVERARQIVEQATVTANVFRDDPNMSYLHTNLSKAKGVLIIPEHGRVAIIVGGAGGSGVLLKKQGGNKWSYPAFYTMGSGSIGLQIGGGVSELILMIMTKRGMDSLLSSSFKLGVDTSVAAGPIGVGAKAQTADILAFARSKGMFVGISVDGSVIKVRDNYNHAYYDKVASSDEIINTTKITNTHADQLRKAVAAMAKVGAEN